MPQFPRLIRVGSLTKEQAKSTAEIMEADGLCTCGRYLKRTDAKFCLGQINTSRFPDARYKNTVVIAAYCYDCFAAINGTLKFLKNKMATPEPDRRRHEVGG